MIKNLKVVNFKCIDSINVEIKPLTILCGPNSSGKSSLSQSLLLLKQSSVALDGIHTLSPIGDVVDLGGYPDLIRNHDLKNKLCFRFELNANSKYLRASYFNFLFMMRRTFDQKRLPYRYANKLIYELDYMYIPDQEKIVLDRISIEDPNRFLIESRKNISGTYRFAYGDISENRKLKWSNPNLKSLTDFLMPEPVRASLLGENLSQFKSEKLRDIRRLFLSFNRVLSDELLAINYLGPFRQVPSRFYMTGGAMPTDIGYKGETAIDYISYLKMSNETEVIEKTKDWLERLNYSKSFDVTTIKNIIKSVQLKDPTTKIEASLVDVGFGISQVLPIIIAVLKHKSGAHIFEQPEIHLHPKSQADIADLFLENIGSDSQLIVETHSEHLINRVRRRVAERKVDPSDIAIYYIDHNREGYHATSISIEKNGSFGELPDSFFDESYQESKKIMEANIKESR